MILTLNQFIGDYRIAVNDSETKKYNKIISQYEPKILRDLLGGSIYTELKESTLGGGSGTPDVRITTIFNELYEDELGCRIYSEGIVKMLSKMMFFYISRSQPVPNTSLGNRVNQAEVSSGIDNTLAIVNYNSGIDTYQAIQLYMLRNRDTYEDFRGVHKRQTSII